MNRTLSNVLRRARQAHRNAGLQTGTSIPKAGLETGATTHAPFGFSTRVAARWAQSARKPGVADVWQRLCWWGATASLLVCLTSAIYRASLPEPNAFDVLLQEPAIEADEF
jgi:hypothetical protein